LVSVNFVIYSTQTIEPTRVDNGFSRTIELCYYGNHYDAVYLLNKFETEIFCQALLFELVGNVVGKQEKSYEYKNIGWECWLQDLKAQERRDELLAQKMLNDYIPLTVPSYSELTGFYRKAPTDDKSSPKSNGKSNTNSKANMKIQFDFEQDNLSDSLTQIALMEEKERLRAIEERDFSAFPALPTATKQNDTLKIKFGDDDNNLDEELACFSVTKEVRNWKDLLVRQANVNRTTPIIDESESEIFHQDYPTVRLTTNLRKNFQLLQDDVINFGSFDDN